MLCNCYNSNYIYTDFMLTIQIPQEILNDATKLKQYFPFRLVYISHCDNKWECFTAFSARKANNIIKNKKGIVWKL